MTHSAAKHGQYCSQPFGLFRLIDGMQAEALRSGQWVCQKCGGEMWPGKAMAQTLVGIPDFPGDDHAVTLSPGGPGRLVDCMKCDRCGWSVTA